MLLVSVCIYVVVLKNKYYHDWCYKVTCLDLFAFQLHFEKLTHQKQDKRTCISVTKLPSV